MAAQEIGDGITHHLATRPPITVYGAVFGPEILGATGKALEGNREQDAVDRAVLRLGAYELGWEPEIPSAVVISEAVELAKQYSTKDSGRFVNGLLSRIAEELRPAGAPDS